MKKSEKAETGTWRIVIHLGDDTTFTAVSA